MSIKSEPTHIGKLVICTIGLVNPDKAREIQLRQTKLFWVCFESGQKYARSDGHSVGQRVPAFRLDLSSIREIL